jgi:nucleoid-associated protein YgaU
MGLTIMGFAPSVLAETDADREREGQAIPGRIEEPDRDRLGSDAAERQREDARQRAREDEGRQDTPPVGANRPGAGAHQATTPHASDRVGGSDGEYVVKDGDTLAKIAQRERGDAKQWKRIAQLNDIDDPKTLAAGKRLQMPDRENRAMSREGSGAMESGVGESESGRSQPGQRDPVRPQ